ncbi:MAG: glycoside hydrolase family 2 TIM barrel-domain containing protein [Saprospiraceae bacterium]
MKIKYYFFCLIILFFSCKEKVKTDNVSIPIPQKLNNLTLPNYWEDPSIMEWGRESARADFKPFETEVKALINQYNSSKYFYNLNGFWKYQYFIGPDYVPANIEKSNVFSSWMDISMPGFIELKGMGKPIFKYYGLPFKLDYPKVPHDSNSVIVLKKSFELSADWTDREIFAVFEGISTSYFVYLNGELVGYNEDTKACSEFNLSKHLKSGLNDLSLVLIRWTDGSYFETHNQWYLTGIYRNSYLLARPKTRIKDYFAQANLLKNIGRLDLNIKVANTSEINSNDLTLEVKILEDKTQKILSTKKLRFNIKNKEEISSKLSLELNSVIPWSDEIPYTYNLLINLINAQGENVESCSSKLAFNSISYGNSFLFNNKQIKIKGVVCHEFHPINGNVMSKEWMDNDMEVLKLHNINAVRDNHYPFESYWYETSQKNGLYVMDECNLDLTALNNSGIDLSNDSSVSKVFLQRVKNTFERNKNYGHIIAWSLGYNAGLGKNVEAAYQYIKLKDSKRPVAILSSNKSYGDLELNSKNISAKCKLDYQIGNSQGNGLGGFKEKWDRIMRDSKHGGGFVEDFTDQCFYMKNKNGQLFFGYGGAFGETQSDSFLCARGLLTSNKTPNPTFKFLAANFANFTVAESDIANGILSITNNQKFYAGENFNYFWTIDSNSVKLAEGRFDKFYLKPGETKNVKIDLSKINRIPGKEYCLIIFIEKIDNHNGMTRFLTQKIEKFCLPFMQGDPLDLNKFEAFNVHSTSDKIEISSNNLKFTIDQHSGEISQWIVDNRDYLIAPISPIFYRAPTDLDLIHNRTIENNKWKNIWTDHKVLDQKINDQNKNKIIVTQTIALPQKPDIKTVLAYNFYSSGDVVLKIEMQNSGDSEIKMPRLSWILDVPSNFGNVKWYGRGPYETYPDRKEGINLGLYTSTVTDFNIPRIRPQEMSNKSDTKWIDISTFNGERFTALAYPVMDAKVLPFPYEELSGKYTNGINLKPGRTNCIILGKEIWPMDDFELGEMKWPKGETISIQIRLKAYKSEDVNAFELMSYMLP